MSGKTALNFKGEPLQMYQPEDGQPAHVTEFGSIRDNLNDILDLYEKDKQEFYLTPVSDDRITEVCRRWNQSMKELIACSEGFIRMYGVTEEDKHWALELMDYAAKDSSRRKETMKNYISFVLKKDEVLEKTRLSLRQLMLDCIHSQQAAMNSQSLYLRYVTEGKNFTDPQLAEDIEASRIAAHWRKFIPEGHHFRPAYIYPKNRIPWGQPVPDWPEPFNRVFDVPVEEKVFDTEECEFILPEGYLSEDGLIDDKSVVWHPETHEVEIGYRGGVRTVWNYKRFIDPREVWEPGSWAAEYQIRLARQEKEAKRMGIFLHRDHEEEVPDYNRIPEGVKRK